MARSRKTFLDLLGSPLTLVPFVLGIGSAIVVWALSNKQNDLAAFLAIAGALGGLGTLLTLWIVYAAGSDPLVRRRRQEMLAGLEALSDASNCKPSAEAEQRTVAARAERG